ncbi:MAG: DUF2779 domain-containing protein [Pseudomonadota bacterium]
MHGLSKSRIVAHRQCPRRLWLQVNHPELAEEGDGSSTRFATGNQVGDIARTLHPGGVLIDTNDLKQALADTARLLQEAPRPLFEATFQADGVLVQADLLLPDGKAWRMAEVKSSSRVKDYHLTDAAVQTWVARQAGVPISRIEIAHIDTSFIYPGKGDYRGLLVHSDITEQVKTQEGEVPGWIASARVTLDGADPQTPPGPQCHDPFDCPFFGHCVPHNEKEDGYPPEILPHSGKLADTLRSEGYADIRHIPEGRLSKPKHVRIWQATRNNEVILDPAAAKELCRLGWPRYYLDFETIQFAVPIWAGTRPYAQIPFQWSCHIEQQDGAVAHLEHLADGSGDPRRAFAESLLTAVGISGPILVYNAAFERSRMRELAADFPELTQALETAIERIVDLLPIAREHYYHPDMRGSWSIKAVLPTIAPDLAYDTLEVADGGMAQEAFTEMIQPETTPDRKAFLYNALLKYCERDTWAMVRVARYFQGGPHAE